MTVQVSQVNMEGHLGSFICDHFITARLFDVESCVNNVIPNIHWTCLVFGRIRQQVGAVLAHVLHLPPRAYRIIGR